LEDKAIAEQVFNRGPRRPLPQKEERPNRINNEIRAKQVRLVGENIENPGIFTFSEAMHLAVELESDLVEISPNVDPPVCKIMDYQKFLYQQKKKQKEIKAKTAKVILKEIRFGPNTDEHDYNFKLKHALSFLQEGSKVKAYVFFKGRSIIYKEQGEILLLKLAQDCEECGKVEAMPKLEGKRMIMMLTPKNSKKS
jgi:translation initiation factor IF-3